MTRTLLVTGLILVALAGAAVFAWLAVDAVWPEPEPGRRYIDEGPDGIAPMDPRLVPPPCPWNETGHDLGMAGARLAGLSRSMAGRVTIHERPVGATVEWYTPAGLFDALGVTFDLDPAASPSPYACVPTAESFHRIHDGLAQDWSGHVWLNPPYGPAAVRFIDRMLAHGDGLLLLPSRTETAAYQRALVSSDAVCLLRDRLWFVRNDGTTGRSSFGSTLFAFGRWAVDVLKRADLGWMSAEAGSAAS